MAGPAAAVLLPNVLTDAEIEGLRLWLTDKVEFDQDSSNNELQEGWKFYIAWPSELGEQPTDDRPCASSLELSLIAAESEFNDDAFYSPADLLRIKHKLGWMPACELTVIMYCNQDRDHRVLAWLCLELVTRYNGVIDLGGELQVSTELPGTVLAIEYDIDEQRTGITQILDPLALQSWLRHARFRMIK